MADATYRIEYQFREGGSLELAPKQWSGQPWDAMLECLRECLADPDCYTACLVTGEQTDEALYVMDSVERFLQTPFAKARQPTADDFR